VPVKRIYGCRVELYRDLIVRGHRFATAVNCSTSGGPYCVYNRFHRVLYKSVSVGSCCVVAAHDKRT
jgi:hypothetical protein